LTRVRAVAGPLLTFHLITFALIFFRASSLPLAIEYVEHLIPGLGGGGVAVFRLDWAQLGLGPSKLLRILVCLAVMETLHWASRQADWRDRFLAAPRTLRWGVYYAAILIVAVFGNLETQKFIYAQF